MRIDPTEGQLMDKKFDRSLSVVICLVFRECAGPPACVSVLERPRLNSSVSEPAEVMSQKKQKDVERSSMNMEVQVFSTVSVL